MNAKEYIFYNFEFIGYYIFGFGLIFYGLYHAIKINEGWGAILISLGIFVIAWGISRKSSLLAEDVAKASLYETLGRLEDKRLAIRDRFKLIQDKLENKLIDNKSSNFKVVLNEYSRLYTYSVWKCKEYLDEALFFKKYFKNKEENQIIHFIDCFYQDLCDGKRYLGIPLLPEYIHHLEIIYDNIRELEAFDRNTDKAEARRMRLLINLDYLRNEQSHHISYFKHSIIF